MKKPRAKKPRAAATVTTPARIAVHLVDGKVGFLREVANPSSFRDSFPDGPIFRDTFADGGTWESNFNNMMPNANNLRHPAIRAALEKIRDAAAKALEED